MRHSESIKMVDCPAMFQYQRLSFGFYGFYERKCGFEIFKHSILKRIQPMNHGERDIYIYRFDMVCPDIVD
jgi:hypothetical protein